MFAAKQIWPAYPISEFGDAVGYTVVDVGQMRKPRPSKRAEHLDKHAWHHTQRHLGHTHISKGYHALWAATYINYLEATRP